MSELLVRANPADRRFGTLDVHYAGLLLLFVAEAFAFYAQLADRILPFHPISSDQVAYTVDTYRLFDSFLKQGWLALFAPILHPDSANGLTFAFQGALMTLVGGANRATLLTINFAYFVILQIVLFKTVRDRLHSSAFAWIALALLLSLVTYFNHAGGIYDFRIDFTALCLYGIWICLLVRSDGFSDIRAGLIVTLVGVWLILLRFITVVYVGAVFGGLLVAVLLMFWHTADVQRRAVLATKIANVFICGALTALVAFPFMFAARQKLYEYYGVGHFFGDEKYIRAAELGLKSSYDHLTFYPHNVVIYHLGSLNIWLMCTLVLASAAIALVFGRTSLREQLRGLGRYGFDLLACALAVIAPLAILTLDYSKSWVVGGIVVVPLILFTLLLSAGILQESGIGTRVAGRAARLPMLAANCTRVGALVLFLVGFSGFLGKNVADPNGMPRPDREQIVALNQAIVRYVDENGMVAPRVSVDRVTDYLNAGTLELYGFESLHRIVGFSGYFGHGHVGIFATPRDEAVKLIQNSDIVILTDPNLGRDHPYPMNAKIKEYWGELWRWTNDNLVLARRTDVLDIPHYVFARPSVRVSGLSGPWVTSSGLIVDVDSSHLKRWPFIVLQGPSDDSHYARYLGGRPKVTAAVAEGPDKAGVSLPATFRTAGSVYQIVVDARALADASAGRRQVKISFDRFFVPAQVNAGTDVRELVIIGPTSWLLRAQAPD
jgi:hypothetical protein